MTLDDMVKYVSEVYSRELLGAEYAELPSFAQESVKENVARLLLGIDDKLAVIPRERYEDLLVSEAYAKATGREIRSS